MRILIINPRFWPDTSPYAMMLRSFGEYLVKRGRHVQVVTERPINRDEFKIPASPSRETVAGMDVLRLRRLPFTASNRGVRLLDRLPFAPRVVFMGLRLRIRGVRYDFVWAATTPPIVNGLAALAVSRLRGARLVYHVQDIIPELGVHSGHWKEGSLLYRLLFAMDNFTSRHARVCIDFPKICERPCLFAGCRRRKSLRLEISCQASSPGGTGAPYATTWIRARKYSVLSTLGKSVAFKALKQWSTLPACWSGKHRRSNSSPSARVSHCRT